MDVDNQPIDIATLIACRLLGIFFPNNITNIFEQLVVV